MSSTRQDRDAIRRAVKPIVALLDENQVGYAVVGSVAGISHGYGRTTIDVDMVAELKEGDLPDEFERRFQGAYFVDAAMIRDAIRWRGSFNLYHFETGIKIDIFSSKGRAFDRELILRRELETMDDDVTPAFFVQTAEDTVLSKLSWYRIGNQASDRQWLDITAILKLQTFTLDFDYLDKWARELNISDLLEKALDESGLKT